MKILICEDEEIMLTAIEFRLRKFGFTLIRAADGSSVIQAVREQKPDLLIVNLSLPDMSGLTLIEYLRSRMSLLLPILLVAPLEAESAILEALRLGANDFIAKPFRPDELLVRIKWLQQAQATHIHPN